MEPIKTDHTTTSAATSLKEKQPFFSFGVKNSSTFFPAASTGSGSNLIQRSPAEGDISVAGTTEEEQSTDIKHGDILDAYPGIEEALPPELVDELALFFVQYDRETGRRGELPFQLLPFTYQQDAEISSKQMGALNYQLEMVMYEGDQAAVEDVLDCCYMRMHLFEIETDLYEKVAALELGMFVKIFPEFILQNLLKIQANLKELQQAVTDLKKLLTVAESNVTGAQIEMAIGLLMDGITYAFNIANPWIGLGIEVGKFAISRYVDEKLGPDMDGFINDLEVYNELWGGALGFQASAGMKSLTPEMNSALKKLGAGSFILGNLLDINEINVAVERRDQVAAILLNINAKFQKISKLYQLIGGENFIARMKLMLRAFVNKLADVKDDVRRLEGEVISGTSEFNEYCNKPKPEE